MLPLPDEKDPIYVVIDREKHSLVAVKWAIENLVIYNQTLVLINVRTRNGGNSGSWETNGGSLEGCVFAPFHTYCARKGIMVQEVVLEGSDAHSTLLDYINKNNVTNIVLGTPSRNAITWKFWTQDLPTLINKAAPDFCSVYVISKGKIQSIRPAATYAACATIPKLPLPQATAKFNRSDPEMGSYRACPSKGDRKSADHESLNKWSKYVPGHSQSSSVGTHRDLGSLSSLDIDLTDPGEISDITQVGIKVASNAGADLDDKNEVQRLKMEVQQTMDMYNTACKQAVSTQQKVDELQQLKMDEKTKIEQARLAEEAALALVEMEKAKCRAAIEAAEKAQRIAEKEARRRKHAEERAKREEGEKNRALDVLSRNDVRYRRYTMEEIQASTNNFSKNLKIGEGGYGPVYKAKLDYTPVAIKVLRSDVGQGRKQFQQEVEVLSCIRHPNMVLLLGACPEYGCLVYEFMDNGSLEDRLFRKSNTFPIPWGVRFKIAADIARGLLFLHQSKPEPLVHRDLKPANILLDHNYSCKISDVGLARLVPPSVADTVTQYHMTSAAGTFCYIDPEYQQTGKLGTKSDIYSLGVVLLQIITARPPMGLTHHVERAIEKGTFADLLDPTVPNWPIEETLGFAKMALKCAELRKKDRPDLANDVLPELNRVEEFALKHGLGHWHPSHRSESS